MESLIAAVREQEEAARFLAWPGDFDLDRGDHVEEVQRLDVGVEDVPRFGDGPVAAAG
ncbi:hypothetical protein ACFWWM_38415 [Streptomyces sp. NPDC058682]|uniref:hypothetical protein n=1 Tax=Streptomyces sp. NPDC058682 TaxID=3346596 RepID=UPI00364AE0AA